MRDETSGDTLDTDTVSRRSFVQTVGVAGSALVGIGASSGQAAAAENSSYTIMDGTDHETTIHAYDSGAPGPTTLVVGGMHGDEESGYTAAHDIADWRVDAGQLYVVPELNKVGVERSTRTCDHGDLNRAFPPTGGECDHWVAREVWDEVRRIDPDWAFDLHASYGIYSQDTGVGQAMFPTWTSPARSTGENTVAALNEKFGLEGRMQYTMGNTLDADRPMLMHRIAGVLDRPGFICETYRGDGTPLSDQVAWHKFCVEYTMKQYGQTRVTGTKTTSESTSDPTWEAWPITVDDPWKSFDLHFEYSNPVVIAKSLSYAGSNPAHARLDDVTGTSFDCRVEEWDYLNDIHYPEETGMLAMEAGAHTYRSGAKVQAGHVVTDESWSPVSFDQEFAGSPVVFAQTQTTNGSQSVVTRVADVTSDGFSLRLQEEGAGDGHLDERVGYVAIEQGSGKLGPKPFEAGVLSSVTDEWSDVAFEGSYADPVFLCGVQSFAGSDPCAARVADLSGSGAAVMVEEERSADSETNHVPEQVGYVVMEN